MDKNSVLSAFDEIVNDERIPYKLTEKKRMFGEWKFPACIAGYELLRPVVEQKKNILLEHSSGIR